MNVIIGDAVPEATSSKIVVVRYVRIYVVMFIGEVVEGFVRFAKINVIGFVIMDGREVSCRQLVFMSLYTVTC